MLIKQITFSFSIAFISWTVGIILNALLAKTAFFQPRLTKLNFIKNEQVNSLLGLGLFKYVLLHSFFKFLNPKLSMKKKIMASELTEYRQEMTKAELNHLLAFGFMNVSYSLKSSRGCTFLH